MNIEKLFETIEGNGWTVEKEGENQYRLGKFSSQGQDFGITVEGESVEELIDDIYVVYEDFDVSTETYLWLDDSGHGKNGAPHDMRDVYEDMEHCRINILKLHTSLESRHSDCK